MILNKTIKMDEKEAMEFHAVLSEAAYIPGNEKKFQYIQKYYGDRYVPLEQHTDKHHVAVMDAQTGRVHLGIRGTDITDAQSGKKADLGADALVTLGLHKLGNRYKKSDKKVKELIDEYGKENVTLGAHSLGGTIASDLSTKYGIESHSYNRGGSHATFQSNKLKSLHPAHQERSKKNNVYFSKPNTSGFDPLSLGTSIDPLANVKFVDKKQLPKKKAGIIESHSIHHFMPESPPRKAMPKKEIKRKNINGTKYTK